MDLGSDLLIWCKKIYLFLIWWFHIFFIVKVLLGRRHLFWLFGQIACKQTHQFVTRILKEGRIQWMEKRNYTKNLTTNSIQLGKWIHATHHLSFSGIATQWNRKIVWPAFKVGRVVRNRTFMYKGLTVTWFLATRIWRLVTRPTCNIVTNGFLFCTPRKLYFHFWSKSQGKSNRNRNYIFSFPWESQGPHIWSFLVCFIYPS